MYWRFASDLPRFVRRRVTLEDARATVRHRLATREEMFLRLVDRGVFGNPRSPYIPLMKQARCEPGDVCQLVRDRGLEGTLRELRSAGVYVTFEEFKGRTPIVRDGRVLPVSAHDFDNPFLSHHYTTESGGSTGVGTRLPHDLNHMVATTATRILALDAHGVLDMPTALWRGMLPDGTGIGAILRGVLIDNVPVKWFTPIIHEDLRPVLKYRLATSYVCWMTRLLGVPVPRPEPVRLERAHVIAEWARDTVKARGAAMVRASVSMLLRVAVAAAERGIDLTGVTFMGGGEPPTPAKVQGIRQTGARYIPNYAFSEGGPVGIACARPIDGSDVHFTRDVLALIQEPRTVPGTELSVDAFYFTTLLPTAPKLMLNVESDDYGILETRSCGCPLEEAGYGEHIRDIRSFRKLTGEGVTLVGSDMVHILEEVLPARFGGTAQDYQLLEEEDQRGFTRLNLLVSPRVEIADESAVIETVFDELSRANAAADQACAYWSQAGTLRLKRMEPVWTARGKLMPFRSTRSSSSAAPESSATAVGT